MPGTLFVVGTPIGNLEDLTTRARRVLGEVDVVACEDTRRTGLLLSRLGLRAPRLLSFFEGNEGRRVPEVVSLLREGADVALVTDAGMPSVSDPGFALVRRCVEAGIEVSVVPGPSAVTAALVASGLPTDRFVFEGFLPRSGTARRERLGALAGEPRTIVLFETARRVAQTLRDLGESCGQDRQAAVCRELTKLHEEVVRGSLVELAERFASTAPRGEIVLVVGGAPDRAADPSAAIALARELVGGGMRKRDAAKLAASRTGVPARRIYGELISGEPAGGSSTFLQA